MSQIGASDMRPRRSNASAKAAGGRRAGPAQVLYARLECIPRIVLIERAASASSNSSRTCRSRSGYASSAIHDTRSCGYYARAPAGVLARKVSSVRWNVLLDGLAKFSQKPPAPSDSSSVMRQRSMSISDSRPFRQVGATLTGEHVATTNARELGGTTLDAPWLVRFIHRDR
jgi:hypothetical protein